MGRSAQGRLEDKEGGESRTQGSSSRKGKRRGSWRHQLMFRFSNFFLDWAKLFFRKAILNQNFVWRLLHVNKIRSERLYSSPWPHQSANKPFSHNQVLSRESPEDGFGKLMWDRPVKWGSYGRTRKKYFLFSLSSRGREGSGLSNPCLMVVSGESDVCAFCVLCLTPPNFCLVSAKGSLTGPGPPTGKPEDLPSLI